MKLSDNKIRDLKLVLIFIFSFQIGLIIKDFINRDKSVATMVVTDLKGNRVNVKPKSVVCLAERPNETLICRVESVR